MFTGHAAVHKFFPGRQSAMIWGLVYLCPLRSPGGITVFPSLDQVLHHDVGYHWFLLKYLKSVRPKQFLGEPLTAALKLLCLPMGTT